MINADGIELDAALDMTESTYELNKEIKEMEKKCDQFVQDAKKNFKDAISDLEMAGFTNNELLELFKSNSTSINEKKHHNRINNNRGGR